MKPAYRFGMQTPGVLRVLETGSRVYGKPNLASDWDVVLLCTEAARDTIMAELAAEEDEDYEDQSVRDGAVNYILTTSPERFGAWQRGTERCLKEAPVYRSRAIEIHAQERRELVEVEL